MLDAVALFRRIADTPNSDKQWLLKAHKQLAKLAYAAGQHSDVLEHISHIVRLLPAINGNYAEESVNRILARYSHCANKEFVWLMYSCIIGELEKLGMAGFSAQRLWLRINSNRLADFLERLQLDECPGLISAIRAKLAHVSELTQATFTLEVIAAEIELVQKTSVDLVRLAQLHLESTRIKSSITHPRTMGVIKECGATLHFHRGNYEKAFVDFYDAFKSYDEAGAQAKKRVLKCYAVCLLLTELEVNAFELPETRTYASLEEFAPLLELTRCFEQGDLERFMAVSATFEEPLFASAAARILENMRVRTLQALAGAYSTMHVSFVLEQLRLAQPAELVRLLLRMANTGAACGLQIDLTLSTVLVGQPLVFPDAETVQSNFAVYDSVGFGGFWRQSGIYEELVGSHSEALAGRWAHHVKSAIPEPRAVQRLQKEQVMTEQREEREEAEAHASTQAGILQLTLAVHDEEETVPGRRHLLEEWCRSVEARVAVMNRPVA